MGQSNRLGITCLGPVGGSQSNALMLLPFPVHVEHTSTNIKSNAHLSEQPVGSVSIVLPVGSVSLAVQASAAPAHNPNETYPTRHSLAPSDLWIEDRSLHRDGRSQ